MIYETIRLFANIAQIIAGLVWLIILIPVMYGKVAVVAVKREDLKVEPKEDKADA